MPTYADLYNEKLRAEGRPLPTNPVRLTISKGEYVWDAEQCRFRYEEEWEEEQLMEFDEPLSQPVVGQAILEEGRGNTVLDSSAGERAPEQTRERSRQLRDELSSSSGGSEMLKALRSDPCSLWVLDTNTLMSCLDLLKALFASLLTRNVAAAQTPPALIGTDAAPRPALIRLVIPYVVISELDGLKTSRRKEDSSGKLVASMARDANSWLLSALQKQKRVPIDADGSGLPSSFWPLFVQPSSHSSRFGGKGGSFDDRSNDELIIGFCSLLRRDTGQGVWFCSDDVNARTRAELEGIDSLGMRELARGVGDQFSHIESTERRMMHIADALIEQWEYQAGIVPNVEAPRHPVHYPDPDGNPANTHLPQHMHPTNLPSAFSGSTDVPDTTIGIIETEMEMADESPTMPMALPTSSNSVTPLTLPSRVPIHPYRNPPSASQEGRNTSDSIHAPGYSAIRRGTHGYTYTPHVATHHSTIDASPAPTASAQMDEELNPQIDWSDLVRSSAPRKRW
ncbi:hypothetical protein BCV70DRAFT_198597 [Testicularia cyperi]|uniref:PIN domain-containing protein n=1 Tax=Testicularia cyperi TaxID=1882483 RepID=A0A317XVL3_9BASI|nr:hypothetical protein BCV70DRAFT_198597 [Testicularia cyperi]